MKRIIALLLAVLLLLPLPVAGLSPPEEGMPEEKLSCGTPMEVQEKFYTALVQNKLLELQRQTTPEDGVVQPLIWRETDNRMPSTGDVNILVLPITFAGAPLKEFGGAPAGDAEAHKQRLERLYFAEDDGGTLMSQSVRASFQRFSFGRLNISGDILLPYEAEEPRSYYAADWQVFFDLISEALATYDIDYAKYDADGNGHLDALVVTFGLASPGDSGVNTVFKTNYAFDKPKISLRSDDIQMGDMVAIGLYGTYSGGDVHELAHLMGLLDNYAPAGHCVIESIHQDVMADSYRYFNMFYKYLLGWVDPVILTASSPIQEARLYAAERYGGAANTEPKAVLYLPDKSGLPFTEFYIAEYRNATGSSLLANKPGITLWHVDATLGVDTEWTLAGGSFAHSKWYLKSVRPTGSPTFSAADLFVPPGAPWNAYSTHSVFSPTTTVNSHFYGTVNPLANQNGDLPTGFYMEVTGMNSEYATIRAGNIGAVAPPAPIEQAPLVITDPGAVTYGDAAFQLETTGGSGDGAVTYAVTSGDAATVTAGGLVTIVKAGTATATATKAGDDDYLPATSAPLTITVDKAPLTVTAANKAATYGDNPPTYTATYSSFVNGESATNLGGTLAFSCTYAKNSPVGSYPITPSGLTSNNYAITFAPGTLTVSPRNLTNASIASIPSVTYTGAAQTPAPAVTDSGAAITTADYTVGYTDNTNAGTATVTLTGKGNYTGTKPAQFEIEKAVLTIRAVDKSIAYGGAAPAFTYTVDGFVGGDDEGVLSGAPALSTDYSTDDPAGDYAILAALGTLSADNYGFTFAPGTLSVGKTAQSTLNVTPIPAKTYGGAAFQLETTGGDGTGAVTFHLHSGGGVLSITGTTATILSAGTAEVYATKAGDANYSSATSEKIMITVQPRDIDGATIAAIPAQGYTGAKIMPEPSVTDGGQTLVKGTDFTYSYGANTTPGVGTGFVTITGTGNYDGTKTVQFDIAHATLTAGDFAVTGTSKPYTGAAQSAAVAYANGITETQAGAISVTYSASPVNVGTYDVLVTTAGGTIYAAIAAPLKVGTLTVSARDMTNASIAAISAVTYTGAAQTPALSVTDSGAVITAADYDVSYLNNATAGTATVTLTGKGNYTGIKTAQFTIQPKQITITAQNASMTQNAALPGFTHTVTGLVSPDTLTTPPQYTCATDGKAVGSFTITPHSADAGGNYTISYQSGTLTVTAAPSGGNPGGSTGGNTSGSSSGGGGGGFVLPPVVPPVEPEPPAAPKFTDVPETHWAAKAIETVTERGLFQGGGDGSFDPGGTMTRAMFATVLARLDGVDLAALTAAASFADVPGGTWYAAPVAWAASLGVVSGAGDGTFRPDTPVTREQMAVMLYNYVKLMGYELTQSAAAGFSDAESISPWAAEAAAFMQAAGLITGRDGGIFDPQGVATRAEVAAIFERLLEKLG